jgi:4a-hydroxytetrahydrobiopterin dehydratase
MTATHRVQLAPALRGLAATPCRPGASRLSADELESHLRVLAGWTGTGERIVKEFRFDDYHATMAFVNAVAEIAHREDHHPDLAVHYGRCVVTFSTHDAGGVTLNDIICAAQVECLPA